MYESLIFLATEDNMCLIAFELRLMQSHKHTKKKKIKQNDYLWSIPLDYDEILFMTWVKSLKITPPPNFHTRIWDKLHFATFLAKYQCSSFVHVLFN